MPIQTDEMHLRDYLRIVSKRRKLVLAVFLSCYLLVLLVGLTRTPLYHGTTRLLIEKAAAAEFLDQSSNWDPLFYETQFQLIKSDAVARRVVQTLGLDKGGEPVKSGGLRAWLGELKGLFSTKSEEVPPPVSPSDEKLQGLAKAISGNIAVTPVRNSRIVEISYLSPNPAFAAQVANSVARAYIEETLQMKLDFARLTLDWMTRKAEEERKKLDEAESRLQQYMVQHSIVSLENRGTIAPDQLSQLSSELVQAESQRKELESLYARAFDVRNNPAVAETLPAIARDPSLQTLRSQILEAEQQVLKLSSEFGPKHPAMKKAANDLDSLKQKKLLEIQRIIASIGNELESARSREESLRVQYAHSQGEALDLSQKFIQYGALKREVDANRQLYDALMLKIKEQSVTQDTQPVNVWIVEPAVTPKSAIKPNKRKVVLAGFIVCLMLGVGLAFFIEYLDNTVKYPDETERQLGVSVLGQVSRWGEDGKEVEHAVQESPRSAFAENYKALRAAITLSKPEGAPRRILITSPGPGAGKTTTAVNLATAMAQADKKVLLIDADLRKPRLHKLFRKTNQTGLSSYLAGGGGKDLLKRGPMDNLTLITSGPIPPNPSELLCSNRMATMLEELSREYDVIICDSPPLMSVADARVLSPLFEGIILVVRAHMTPYDLARKAIRLLTDVNAPLLGLVINALDLKKGDYYYNYYYSSYGEEPTAEAATEPAKS